jgi:hypothetical protein
LDAFIGIKSRNLEEGARKKKTPPVAGLSETL